MSRILLKKILLKNFKGIKELAINFREKTDICGDNGTGKTTVADAFMWLLFDKDSRDRKDFEIKTLDSNNQVIHGLDHEVTGVLNVNGKDVVLSKTYREKWTKKRGEADKELTGHETLYYIDEVPVKKSEYQDKVNGLIDEQLFKLLTNPLYFSTNIKWQDRRNVVLEIIGDIPVERILNYRRDLGALEVLLADKDIDTLKKSIAARKKKLNDDIKSIPYRIDECNNSIDPLDFEALELEKRNIISAIKAVDDTILDNSKISEGVLKEKNKLYELKSKLIDIEQTLKKESQRPLDGLRTKLYELKNQVSCCKQTIWSLENGIKSDEKSVEELEKELNNLREQFSQINAETLVIEEDSFICPTCKRALEESDIESQKVAMQENFNQSKSKRLGSINSQGKTKKERLLKLQNDLEQAKEHLKDERAILLSLESDIEQINTQISNFNAEIKVEDNNEYQEILTQVRAIETKLQQPSQTLDVIASLKTDKRSKEYQLEDINKQLARKQINENMKNRIAELMEEERALAKQIAELEGHEYMCEEFIRAKVELLESSINSKFKYVSFKLFDTQVNGGLVETCEALIDGVPFSNANTASQINAGLDIINALSEYYNVSAPIFIDNRESVNEIIECNSQIINLVVSKDKTLQIISLESEVA